KGSGGPDPPPKGDGAGRSCSGPIGGGAAAAQDHQSSEQQAAAPSRPGAGGFPGALADPVNAHPRKGAQCHRLVRSETAGLGGQTLKSPPGDRSGRRIGITAETKPTTGRPQRL